MPERPAQDPVDDSIVLHEERLRLKKGVEQIGTLRIRKTIETGDVTAEVPRGYEQARIERKAPAEQDSGQVETLPDGSVSIPVFEEELVVSRRLVVRERIIVRKQTLYESEPIREQLRREQVEVQRIDHPDDSPGS
jgi:uncharacterized protein (TIGR02271 family)